MPHPWTRVDAARVSSPASSNAGMVVGTLTMCIKREYSARIVAREKRQGGGYRLHLGCVLDLWRWDRCTQKPTR
jgi:hypothetical protein